MQEHYLNSSLREKLIEHLFVGELLKLAWLNNDYSCEIAKPEVDNAGYDLIIEANNVLRHVQLKSAFLQSSTAAQSINIALAKKPSGCVVWIYFDPETLKLGPFLFFGAAAGEPLPDLSAFKVAKHTKGDASGHKAERANIRKINKGAFTQIADISQLYQTLFRA